MSTSVLAELIKKKAGKSSNNLKQLQNIYSFNFDDLPDYEPLEVTLQALRQSLITLVVYDKILSMDAGEFVEHPQWEEFLQLLHHALLTSSDPAAITKIMLIYMKFIKYFDEHPQGIDVTCSFFECILLSLTKSEASASYDANKTSSMSYQPSYICSMVSDSSVNPVLYDYISSIDFYRVLMVSMIHVIRAIAAKKKLGQYNNKSVDRLLVLLFAIMAHASIEINLPDDPIISHHISLYDAIIYVDHHIADAYDNIILSYHHTSILQHAVDIGLIGCLYMKISSSIIMTRQLLSSYKALDGDSGIIAVHLIKQLLIAMHQTIISIRFYMQLICDHHVIPHDAMIHMLVTLPSSSSPMISTSSSSSPMMKQSIAVDFIPNTNKKFCQLSSSSNIISHHINDINSHHQPSSSSSSTPSSSGHHHDKLSVLMDLIGTFLSEDMMSILSLIAADDALAISWLSSLSSLLKHLLSHHHHHHTDHHHHHMRSYDRIIHHIIDAYRSIHAVRATGIIIDARIISLLDNLIVVILENLYPILELRSSFDDDDDDVLHRALCDVTAIIINHDALLSYISHTHHHDSHKDGDDEDEDEDDDDMTLMMIDATVGRCLQLLYRSWRPVMLSSSSSSSSMIHGHLISLLSISSQLFNFTNMMMQRYDDDAYASYMMQHDDDDDPMMIIDAWSYTKQVSSLAIIFTSSYINHHHITSSSSYQHDDVMMIWYYDSLMMMIELSLSIIYDAIKYDIHAYDRHMMQVGMSDIHHLRRWSLDYYIDDIITAVAHVSSILPDDMLIRAYDTCTSSSSMLYDVLSALDIHPHVWEILTIDDDMMISTSPSSSNDDISSMIKRCLYSMMRMIAVHGRRHPIFATWLQAWPALTLAIPTSSDQHQALAAIKHIYMHDDMIHDASYHIISTISSAVDVEVLLSLEYEGLYPLFRHYILALPS